MQNCFECNRLRCLLDESGFDYLTATNRYNTLLHTVWTVPGRRRRYGLP